eukprot:EG_transcript_45582
MQIWARRKSGDHMVRQLNLMHAPLKARGPAFGLQDVTARREREALLRDYQEGQRRKGSVNTKDQTGNPPRRVWPRRGTPKLRYPSSKSSEKYTGVSVRGVGPCRMIGRREPDTLLLCDATSLWCGSQSTDKWMV